MHGTGVAQLHRRSGCSVFCYHNVVPDNVAGGVGDPWLHAGVTEFTSQIEWIARSFTVVHVGELLSRLRSGRSIARLAALTFDDGYAGVIDHAIPIVRRLALPFTLFPVIRAVDEQRPFWWDLSGHLQTEQREELLSAFKGDTELITTRRHQASELPPDALPATWEQLRSVRGADCAVGVHTVTHRNLTTLTTAEVEWEMTHARDRLTDELGASSDLVAYPYGITSSTVQDVARRAGFNAGLSLDFGLIRTGVSPLNLPRVSVPQGLDMARFACWASGLRLRS